MGFGFRLPPRALSTVEPRRRLVYLQHGRMENSFLLAKSILLAVPISVVFFLPFLLAERLGLSFWPTYLVGCASLPLAFFVHQWLARLLWT